MPSILKCLYWRCMFKNHRSKHGRNVPPFFGTSMSGEMSPGVDGLISICALFWERADTSKEIALISAVEKGRKDLGALLNGGQLVKGSFSPQRSVVIAHGLMDSPVQFLHVC